MTDTAPASPRVPATDWDQKLIEELINRGALTRSDSEIVLAQVTSRSVPATTVLADSGVVGLAVSMRALSEISGLRLVDLVRNPPEQEAVGLLPPGIARRFGAIGYQMGRGDHVIVATGLPLAEAHVQKIGALTGCDVSACVLADPTEIARIITQAERDEEIGGQHVDPMLHSLTKVNLESENTEDIDAAVLAQAAASVRTVSYGETSNSKSPSADQTQKSGTSANDSSDAGQSKTLPDIDNLLVHAVQHNASDLHLVSGLPPMIRINGSIRRIEGLDPLNNESLREMIYSILPQAIRERFEATKELDTSYALRDVGRFRVSVMQQRGAVGAVLRMIPTEIPPFDILGLPPIVAQLAELRRGLVLVTGPTGSGKSTTLASLIDIVNRSRPVHIITVEDPIEFMHENNEAIINQREVGVDTLSFSECLRHALRQDPDVILVGEMRDLETISTALTAAETGHLVFATLHTQDAPQTIDRIIDVFPTNQQDQVRIQLAGTLEAVVTQQLLLDATSTTRVPIAEIMVCNAGIRNLIRSAKTHQIYSLMQTGTASGMQTMDQALARAVRDGRITEANAYDHCHNTSELRDHLQS